MPTRDNNSNIMRSKSNNIDDFPAHWKATLLGEEFWRDAEDWNRDTNARIEADHDQSLHTRFPFNIGPEQTPRAPSITTNAADSDDAAEAAIPEKINRRFSMSDALSVHSLTGRSGSVLFPPSRVLERGRNSRSQLRSNNHDRSSSLATGIRRSNSMIRSTFNMLSRRKKIMDEEEEDEDEPVLKPIIPAFTQDQATPAKPLMEFRGGAHWTALPKDRRTLGIDVYWPVPTDKHDARNLEEDVRKQNRNESTEEEEEEDPTIFPIDNMVPLCMFRNLRSLKITGMMQSYQMYIFQAAWLNNNLEELEIGMALPPRLCRGYKWPYMKGGWRLDKATYGDPVYYGNGEGALLRTVGAGEYLDKMCLEKAKIRAMAMGNTRNRLSIRTLILTGVVVDADPFLHWFDPKRLKCINFKDNCVDAGFYLSHCMKKVSILFPRQIDEPVSTGRNVNPLAQLKVIQIKGGKKVGEIPFRGPQSLEEIPMNVGHAVKDQPGEKRKIYKKGKEGVVDDADKAEVNV